MVHTRRVHGSFGPVNKDVSEHSQNFKHSCESLYSQAPPQIWRNTLPRARTAKRSAISDSQRHDTGKVSRPSAALVSEGKHTPRKKLSLTHDSPCRPLRFLYFLCGKVRPAWLGWPMRCRLLVCAKRAVTAGRSATTTLTQQVDAGHDIEPRFWVSIHELTIFTGLGVCVQCGLGRRLGSGHRLIIGKRGRSADTRSHRRPDASLF